jgi:hypothetical protein
LAAAARDARKPSRAVVNAHAAAGSGRYDVANIIALGTISAGTKSRNVSGGLA